MTSCLAFLSTITRVYNEALDTDEIEDREYAYGSENNLAVTFYDGKLYGIWDTEDGYDYSVTVKSDSGETEYDDGSAYMSDGKIALCDAGYVFSDKFELILDKTAEKATSSSTQSYEYDYNGLSAADYDKYTATCAAGFSDIDYYIATRSEWFDFWSYIIIFRENSEYNDGAYEISSDVYMAYPYEDLYTTTTDVATLYSYEVYSAIDAYEDSAAYSYSYDVDDTGVYGSLSLKFYYGTAPKYTSQTAKYYTNATKSGDAAHYRTNDASTPRTYAIDSVSKTVSVSSSDQLYYALKKGYRPVPEEGSNAYYLYDKMKSVLAQIISDGDTQATKTHYIYDYIVDTVLYDYDFIENVYGSSTVGTYQLFSYRSLYLEGVFGMASDGTFADKDRIAICDGLSKAFLCLATIEGVECKKISGTVSDEGHAWNKVKIDGTWYMVDTTWGNSLDEASGKEYLSHDYLLVPDDSRHVESPYYSYPAATKRYSFGSEDIDNDPSDGNDKNSLFPTNPFRRFSA
jgi:hypothetical protein